MRRILVEQLRRLIRWLEVRGSPLPPTQSELEQNVVSVGYEMAAMERAAFLASSGGRFRFEAFHLHARLLREFLWGKGAARGPGASNSLLAEHYLPRTSDWRSIRGGLPPTLMATKDRIDRQIAHLSRDRLGDFMDLEAPVPKILAEIEAQWTRFEEALSPEWAELFQRALTTQRAELAKNHY